MELLQDILVEGFVIKRLSQDAQSRLSFFIILVSESYLQRILVFLYEGDNSIDDKTIRQSIENAWDEMTNAKKDKVV